MRAQFMILFAGAGLSLGCAEETQVSALPASPSEATQSQNDVDLDSVNNSTTEAEEEEAVTQDEAPTKYNELTDFEEYVLVHKGTEPGGVGEYTDTEDAGTYICRRCNAELYTSDQKFHSGCGWPAFDDEIEGAVVRVPDADGMRTEIVCANCKGHLGHVFIGERFTSTNTRHCVNSVSMILIPKGDKIPATIRIDSDDD